MTLKEKIIKQSRANQIYSELIFECPIYIKTKKDLNELLDSDIYCKFGDKDYYLFSGSIFGRPVLINMKLLNLKVIENEGI